MLQICLKGDKKQKSLYLDSGCSRHMTGDRSLFLTLTMKEGGTVGFGGNQTGRIIGSGTIGNSSISINNVWLVDGLRHNLLSISQFYDNGYDVLSEAYQTLTIIQMHSVVHVKKEKLLRLLSNEKTLFQPPDLWNYSTLIYLDQLALHPFMGVNMD